jgi:RNA polymerase sigma factor (TIGR02999 family)
MPTNAPEITKLLRMARQGDRSAEDRLVSSLYPELKKFARRYMAAERGQHTLQPTALVNEVYIRIFGGAPVDWNDRTHFLAVASQQMRRVLADYGRGFRAEKRGNRLRVSLDERNVLADHMEQDIQLTEQLIQRLEKVDALAARVTVLKFYGGMTDGEVANELATSHSQVRRHWQFARAWMRQRLIEYSV